MIWTTAAPAVTTAFLSSLVEAVEALTIVLAVASVRGWRPAALGALAGLALLLLIVVALGPLLNRVPLHALQLVIGVLLLLFGMRWLRKAILRAAGIIALHDEGIAFATAIPQVCPALVNGISPLGAYLGCLRMTRFRLDRSPATARCVSLSMCR